MVVKDIKVLVVITLCLLLGVSMWNFLGGLVGGGLNLLGGLFGQSNQSAINQQNIQQARYMAQNAIQMRVKDAQAAGINPLAALGSSFAPSAATAVGSDALPEAMSSMGQNLSRAAQAYGDATSKATQLDNEYKQAQIDLVHSETAKNLVASKAVVASQPGTPPGLGITDASGNAVKTLPALFRDYSARPGRITLLDPDAQRSVFSGVPGAVTYPALAAALIQKNAANILDYPGPAGVPLTRGDFLRWADRQAEWFGGM